MFVAPGNPGTAGEPKTSNVDVAADDVAGLVRFAADERVDLTIVGPEAPLVLGVRDAFDAAGLRCFGPSRLAARLEGSKAFTKDFLSRHGIPTAAYATFTRATFDPAWVRQQRAPLVVKADGLAAGKGVVICDTVEDAVAAAQDMFAGRFGKAGDTVVVEEFLLGEEASFIAMVDGHHILPLATSQDHKRLGDGDTGPNTGGMGAYSPAPVVTSAVHERAMREVMWPTVRALAAEGTPYVGFLYAGLMITADGRPQVLEFNCRFGDPETQPILSRMRSDLSRLCDAALDGRLENETVDWGSRACRGSAWCWPPRAVPEGAPRGRWWIEGLRGRGGAVLQDLARNCPIGTLGRSVVLVGGDVDQMMVVEVEDGEGGGLGAVGSWGIVGYRAIQRETVTRR